MDMTDHLCESTEAHERFIAHTVDTLIQLGEIAYPHDPVAAARYALRSAGWQDSEVEVRLRQLPERPMDTSDLDPETGEPYGVIPAGQIWVETESTRDALARVAFTAYFNDGSKDFFHMRLSEFERAQRAAGSEVRVLTAQEAQRFHAARGAS
jgi:hypothetical protein